MTNVKQPTKGRKARKKKTNGEHEQLAKVIRPFWRGDEGRALDEAAELMRAAVKAEGCEGVPAAREALSKARALASRHLLRWLCVSPNSPAASLDKFAEQFIVAGEMMNALRYIDAVLMGIESKRGRPAEAEPAGTVKLAEVIPLPIRSRRLRAKVALTTEQMTTTTTDKEGA